MKISGIKVDTAVFFAIGEALKRQESTFDDEFYVKKSYLVFSEKHILFSIKM